MPNLFVNEESSLLSLLQSVPADRFRFLSADGRAAYLAICRMFHCRSRVARNELNVLPLLQLSESNGFEPAWMYLD